ncbi:swi5-like zinc finger protein [Haplosporangium sp. Z 767]|nr:swi5-like zinc finger protein [Haplosporangium sp. Z 767]KAF9194638.1 swi5-like zinc finger protein [Haplosporangium sp. Z 11]
MQDQEDFNAMSDMDIQKRHHASDEHDHQDHEHEHSRSRSPITSTQPLRPKRRSDTERDHPTELDNSGLAVESPEGSIQINKETFDSDSEDAVVEDTAADNHSSAAPTEPTTVAPEATMQLPTTTETATTSAAAVQNRRQEKHNMQEHYKALKVQEDAKIEELKAMIRELEQKEKEIIQAIRGDGTPSEIIAQHIKELHQYNEIKDVGQVILGKCAELEGTTIKEQYEKYGLDPED